MNDNQGKQTRRDFVRNTAYVAPVIMTLAAKPSFAGTGSAKCNNGFGNGSEGCSPDNGAHHDQDE
jgi:hypothetical protein